MCVCVCVCNFNIVCMHYLLWTCSLLHCAVSLCKRKSISINYSLAVYEHVESGAPRINYGAEVNFICNVNRIKCNESDKPV